MTALVACCLAAERWWLSERDNTFYLVAGSLALAAFPFALLLEFILNGRPRQGVRPRGTRLVLNGILVFAAAWLTTLSPTPLLTLVPVEPTRSASESVTLETPLLALRAG